MTTKTKNKINTINTLVEKFQRLFPNVDIYTKSNHERSVVSKSQLAIVRYAAYKSNATYKRFYNTGGHAYRIYVNKQLANFIIDQSEKFKKYSGLIAA